MTIAKPIKVIEKRRPLEQRWWTDALCRHGRFEPVKLFSIFGMAIVSWWMIDFAKDILAKDAMSIVVIASMLIAPTFAHKFLTMKKVDAERK